MTWYVRRIEEADYGCEERMPGEPLTVLVILEGEDGRICKFSVADQWMYKQEINEGDEWPEDPDSVDNVIISSNKQAEWMEGYYDAIEEMELYERSI